MVKELRIESNAELFPPEREEQLLYELVYLGIELPDELREQRRERLGWVPADRDPRSVRSEKAWTAYLAWLGEHPETLALSPSARLNLYTTSLNDN